MDLRSYWQRLFGTDCRLPLEYETAVRGMTIMKEIALKIGAVGFARELGGFNIVMQ